MLVHYTSTTCFLILETNKSRYCNDRPKKKKLKLSIFFNTNSIHINTTTMASFFNRLEQRCRAVDSLLCVGLDPHRQDLEKIGDYSAEGAFNFSKNLIDLTKHVAVAYKPNAAFFEALGADGVRALERGVYPLVYYYLPLPPSPPSLPSLPPRALIASLFRMISHTFRHSPFFSRFHRGPFFLSSLPPHRSLTKCFCFVNNLFLSFYNHQSLRTFLMRFLSFLTTSVVILVLQRSK